VGDFVPIDAELFPARRPTPSGHAARRFWRLGVALPFGLMVPRDNQMHRQVLSCLQ